MILFWILYFFWPPCLSLKCFIFHFFFIWHCCQLPFSRGWVFDIFFHFMLLWTAYLLWIAFLLYSFCSFCLYSYLSFALCKYWTIFVWWAKVPLPSARTSQCLWDYLSPILEARGGWGKLCSSLECSQMFSQSRKDIERGPDLRWERPASYSPRNAISL